MQAVKEFTKAVWVMKGTFIKGSMKMHGKDAVGRSARKEVSSRRQKIAACFIGECLCWRRLHAVLITARLQGTNWHFSIRGGVWHKSGIGG